MNRFCCRCRQYREVDWKKPGTLQVCPTCLELETESGQPFVETSRLRRQAARARRVTMMLQWAQDLMALLGCWVCEKADPASLDSYLDTDFAAPSLRAFIRQAPRPEAVQQSFSQRLVVCEACYRARVHVPRSSERAARRSAVLANAPDLRALFRQTLRSPRLPRPPGFAEAMAEIRDQCFPVRERRVVIPSPTSVEDDTDFSFDE